jgi:hypothetical protein
MKCIPSSVILSLLKCHCGYWTTPWSDHHPVTPTYVDTIPNVYLYVHFASSTDNMKSRYFVRVIVSSRPTESIEWRHISSKFCLATGCYSSYPHIMNYVLKTNCKICPSYSKSCPCASFELSFTPWRRIGAVEVYLHSFFDLGTRWRWVVSFTPRPLYPQGKSPWYPLDRRLRGPQSRSGRGGEEKNSQPLPQIEP